MTAEERFVGIGIGRNTWSGPTTALVGCLEVIQPCVWASSSRAFESK
jgi:hypothetical protein